MMKKSSNFTASYYFRKMGSKIYLIMPIKVIIVNKFDFVSIYYEISLSYTQYRLIIIQVSHIDVQFV